VKPSEIRDRNEEELRELENQLREQLLKLHVAKATQRAKNNSQFARVRKDIARIQTVLNERKLGIGASRADSNAPQGEG